MSTLLARFTKPIDLDSQYLAFLKENKMISPLLEYVTPTTVLIGLSAGILTYWLIKRNRYNLPPGPFAWPLIGDYKIIQSKTGYEDLVEYSKKYGPVVSVYLGPFRMVVLNSIDVVLEALVKRGADFANRVHIFSGDEFSEGCKDIAAADYTPTWKLHRKLASSAFRNYGKSDRFGHAIQHSMAKVTKVLQEQKGAVEPNKFVDLAAFNISCTLCFNTSYEFDDEDFLRIMKVDYDLIQAFGMGLFEDVFPYLRNIWPSKRYTTVKKLFDEAMEYLNKQIEKHRNTYDEDNLQDVTDHLLRARQEAEGEEDAKELSQLTDVHIRQTLSDVFFAGIDSTRFTLYWCILYMAAFPEIQQKCQEEIDAVVERTRLPSPDDKPYLPYTEATLHEVMRIQTVAPLGFPHAARQDSTIGGYDIPKGTTIMINHWSLHMDPNKWKEPEKFDPRRFLEADGTLAPKPESWLPFSAGRRVCLGESLARPELLTVLASFLQQFAITLPEGGKADFSNDGNAFSIFPKKYEVIFKKRV